MSKGNPSVHGGWPDKQEMASLYYKYYSAKKMNKFPVQVVTRMKMLHKAKEARHKGTKSTWFQRHQSRRGKASGVSGCLTRNGISVWGDEHFGHHDDDCAKSWLSSMIPKCTFKKG